MTAKFGGNETDRAKPIWEIARKYNRESRKLNGSTTSRRIRKVKSITRVGIL